MAMTATLTLSPTTTVTEGDCTAIFAISNSSAFPVTVVNIIPFAYPNGGTAATTNTAVSFGPLNIGPNSSLVVPASGSLTLTIPFTPHGPVCGALNGTVTGGLTNQTTYKVGGTCYSDDGSVFVPSEQSLVVNNVVTFASAQQ